MSLETRDHLAGIEVVDANFRVLTARVHMHKVLIGGIGEKSHHTDDTLGAFQVVCAVLRLQVPDFTRGVTAARRQESAARVERHALDGGEVVAAPRAHTLLLAPQPLLQH